MKFKVIAKYNWRTLTIICEFPSVDEVTDFSLQLLDKMNFASSTIDIEEIPKVTPRKEEVG